MSPPAEEFDLGAAFARGDALFVLEGALAEQVRAGLSPTMARAVFRDVTVDLAVGAVRLSGGDVPLDVMAAAYDAGPSPAPYLERTIQWRAEDLARTRRDLHRELTTT